MIIVLILLSGEIIINRPDKTIFGYLPIRYVSDLIFLILTT